MEEAEEMLSVRACVCASIRRADRAVTQFYDDALAPSGLRITQFTLLGTIWEAGPVTMNQLAGLMSMDRTTLTRNLEPLTRQGFVRSEEGEDRRVRLIMLTAEGKAALSQALPLWQQAQARIVQGLGQEHFHALLAELAAVVQLTR
jgi:DNA-binding MarR family transcriptional regulator